MSKDFEMFLSQLSQTNKTLDYFTNFKKINENVRAIEIKLNQLNYLIGKENLKQAIEEIYQENSKTFDVLGMLVAVRDSKKEQVINTHLDSVQLASYFNEPDSILQYIEGTGLSDIFRNKNVNNLVDYVFGVEVDLDTNARKNRSSDTMSKTVSRVFDDAGISYKQEVKSTHFPEIGSLGQDQKQFDFVIKSAGKTYLIEVNYYNSSGSKLNETARSYSDLSPKINHYPNYESVWITDGLGWLSTKRALEEAYNTIPNLYNLKTIKKFIEKIKNEKFY